MQSQKKRFIARVISNNRVTIPDEIVELLKLGIGDLVNVEIEKEAQ